MSVQSTSKFHSCLLSAGSPEGVRQQSSYGKSELLPDILLQFLQLLGRLPEQLLDKRHQLYSLHYTSIIKVVGLEEIKDLPEFQSILLMTSSASQISVCSCLPHFSCNFFSCPVAYRLQNQTQKQQFIEIYQDSVILA